MKATDSINEYFLLLARRPEAFSPSAEIEIVTDRETLEKYARDTGEEIGVIYKSRYNTLVVDLIRTENGYYRYERVLPSAEGKSAVAVPIKNGRLVLIKQYRHPIRKYQLSFPRGFGEDGLTGVENAKKELFEELGAVAEEVVLLGEIAPDSGLSGSIADVVLCRISTHEEHIGYEGITGVCELLPSELEEMIAEGRITDSFTLAAFSMLKARGII